jgi:hypothetical protein
MRSGERSAAKHTSIHLLLSHYGGIVPSVRRRSTQVHTLAEREDIRENRFPLIVSCNCHPPFPSDLNGEPRGRSSWWPF